MGGDPHGRPTAKRRRRWQARPPVLVLGASAFAGVLFPAVASPLCVAGVLFLGVCRAVREVIWMRRRRLVPPSASSSPSHRCPLLHPRRSAAAQRCSASVVTCSLASFIGSSVILRSSLCIHSSAVITLGHSFALFMQCYAKMDCTLPKDLFSEFLSMECHGSIC
jgi:hypothetical protein